MPRFQAAGLLGLGMGAGRIRRSRLFSEDYYRARYPLPDRVDAARHFCGVGWRSGFNPSAFFDTAFYLDEYRDAKAGGMNPLLHYLRQGARERRLPSPLFDVDLFALHHPEAAAEPDLAEYCLRLYDSYTWQLEKKPLWRSNPLFDAKWYLASSPDLAISEEDALAHYLRVGWTEGRDPNPLFDTDWYLAQFADVAANGRNPLLHYQSAGYREGRRPNRFFDGAWYLASHQDVQDDLVDPLQHFMMQGEAEDRDPNPRFSTAWYRGAYPESAAYPWGVFAYHVRVGRRRGDQPHPHYLDILANHPAELRQAETARIVPAAIDPYDAWLEVNQPTDTDRATLRARMAARGDKLPRISVVMSARGADARLLAATVESVRAQIHGDWELCISGDAAIAATLDRLAALDSRIRWTWSPDGEDVAAACNRAAALVTGEIVALLGCHDLVHPYALAEIAALHGEYPRARIAYSDDDSIDMEGRRHAPRFKPGWSPSLLLGCMYMGGLLSFRAELFREVGGFRLGFEGAREHDLVLRMVERTSDIRHIPRVLYHRRAAPGSSVMEPTDFEQGRRAVDEALKRRGIAAKVIPADEASPHPGVVELEFPDAGPAVTIIVVPGDRPEPLRATREALARTAYSDVDIVVLDKGGDARAINAAVRAASGDYVLLLAAGLEAPDPKWLSAMMGHAGMLGVGAVGARLLDSKEHDCARPGSEAGHLGLASVSREVAAVSGACLLTPRKLFLDLGGLDETRFPTTHGDVDYCYRLVDAGHTCVQCASAVLVRRDEEPLGHDDPAEAGALRRAYRGRVDAWHNPNLVRDGERAGIARTHIPQDPAQPLRVAFVSHNLNHEGAPNSLFELSASLRAAARIEPMIVTPQDGPLRRRYAKAGIAVDVMGPPLATSPAPEELRAHLRRIGQAFLYAGADAVVANTADSFWAVEAARIAGIPSLWIIRESEPWDTYYAKLPEHVRDVAYEAFTAPYRVVFVAQATLDAWKPLDSRHGFTLIHNGLNAAELVSAYRGLSRSAGRRLVGATKDDCVFVCIGTVAARKGQCDLVAAHALLPPELAMRARIVIVGDRPGEYSDELHAVVAALPADKRRRILVVGETSKAKTYLVGADVAVCTSRVESYPRVTLEAMASGLPLVTTGVWGIREQVRPGYNALLYEPGDAVALAAHMAEMIRDGDKRRLFASRAVPVFESLPDFESMRDGYAALIRQAVGSR